MLDPITDKNFALYAARHYNSPHTLDCDEFDEDLSRIRYVKRHAINFRASGSLNLRLTLNHLIVFANTFGIIPATRMALFRLKDDISFLLPLLKQLNMMPDRPVYINDELTVDPNHICDPTITQELSKL